MAQDEVETTVWRILNNLSPGERGHMTVRVNGSVEFANAVATRLNTLGCTARVEATPLSVYVKNSEFTAGELAVANDVVQLIKNDFLLVNKKAGREFVPLPCTVDNRIATLVIRLLYDMGYDTNVVSVPGAQSQFHVKKRKVQE